MKEKSVEHHISVPAIEVAQGVNRRMYSFAMDGKQVPEVAAVSRIRRDEKQLAGYQRPEVLSHIAEIRGYLESDSPMIPNAIVLAFDSRVQFLPDPGKPENDYTRTGTLQIPVHQEHEDQGKPGFVVDGQQRLAAIRDARVDHFPIMITAFITDDVKVQKEQFMLVNSTRPLPKSLIYELLPGTDVRLPSTLQKKKFPAHLLERLNSGESSPLKGMIKTSTNPEGIIKDNSVLRMLENSLSDGALYRFRSLESGAGTQRMVDVLNAFWGAVATVFDDAWGLPPRKSRLMHGAGVVSMGFVMDAIVDRHAGSSVLEEDLFVQDLLSLRSSCRWTHGYWDFGPGAQRKWNEIQNTPKDVQLLANFLLIEYKSKVWNASIA